MNNILRKHCPSRPILACLRQCIDFQFREFACATTWRKPSSFAFGRSSMAAQKSFRVSMKEELKNGDITNDLGLLPGTLIMPTGLGLPSIFHSPKDRLNLEWVRLFTRFKDLASIFLYVKVAQKPRPKIQFWNKIAAAKTLHTQMYSAFANGEIDVLKTICTEGVLDKLTSRIHRRKRSEKFRWTLHKYLGVSRVVSHRAAPLPGIEGAGIRQAVVRLRSQQSLQKVRENAPEDMEGVRNKTEYIVIQKRLWNNQEGPWMVWGTIDESDWKTDLHR